MSVLGRIEPMQEGNVQPMLSFKENLSVVRLTGDDARRGTDLFLQFRDRVLENETVYPGIDHWMRNKMIPGLSSRERSAFICCIEGLPIATAVVKHGRDAKFCHLKIDKKYQDQHLGEMLFTLMSLEVGDEARRIYFTLPESLWERRRRFFESFGFNIVRTLGYKYRRSDPELYCSAPLARLWLSIEHKLPKLKSHFVLDGLSMDNTMLMTVKPRFVTKILKGSKTVEVRRRFHRRWVGHRVSLYASAPLSSLVGQATITSVKSSDPPSIWDEFGHQIGCTEEEFFAYVGKADEVFAIHLDDIEAFKHNIKLGQISNVLGCQLFPPQSYCGVTNNGKWSQALAFATLLQNRVESQQ